VADRPPVVYVLHGEDEFSIARALGELEKKFEDPATAALNTNRFEGGYYSLEDLHTAASSVPFLAARRLVVIYDPLSRLKGQNQHQKFLDMLDGLPETTALVVIIHHSLDDDHWLLRWANKNGPKAFERRYSLHKGAAMARWIQAQARESGGQFTPQAAALLAALIGEDSRQAYQEIQKLVAYANYQRPVMPEDVENLTAADGQGDIFAMVDALGNQDGQVAMRMLHHLLERQDPLSIFGMVVRQFRLLLLSREVLDGGGGEGDVARELKLHPFVARKVTAQARRFSIPVLESVYRRLVDVDAAIKTGQIDGDLALDTLVAAFTSPS
jgi:DNA polymerase-3 subunit delta